MTIGVTQLRKRLFDVLDDVESRGTSVDIERNGKVVAVLSPPPARESKPTINLNEISSFCIRHGVSRFSLFGSILRGDFNESSDVDVLLDLPREKWTYGEHCRMLDELEHMFGRDVDLTYEVALGAMEPKVRESITSSKSVFYDEAAA